MDIRVYPFKNSIIHIRLLLFVPGVFLLSVFLLWCLIWRSRPYLHNLFNGQVDLGIISFLQRVDDRDRGRGQCCGQQTSE